MKCVCLWLCICFVASLVLIRISIASNTIRRNWWCVALQQQQQQQFNQRWLCHAITRCNRSSVNRNLFSQEKHWPHLTFSLYLFSSTFLFLTAPVFWMYITCNSISSLQWIALHWKCIYAFIPTSLMDTGFSRGNFYVHVYGFFITRTKKKPQNYYFIITLDTYSRIHKIYYFL